MLFARFLQIRDRIVERKNEEIKFKLKLEELKLRTICTFVAATGFDGKSAKANVRAAGRITLYDEKKADEEVKKEDLKPGGYENALAFFGKFEGRK